ncbi:MAG: hypothetical protein B7Z55_05855, partial [Planctomycetales bacterium 12-60-4]
MNLYRKGEPGTESSPQRGPSGVGWFVAACLGSTLLIAAGVLIGGGWLGAVRPPLQQRLWMAEGRDSQTCPETLTAPDGWELRWEHDGELQEICWTSATGKTECVAAMHRKPIRPQGSVNIGHGGTYTIRVTGTGKWQMEAYVLAPQQ